MRVKMYRGLPGSGKTTLAMKDVKDGFVRINKDDLRTMLHGGKWSKANEKMVIKVRDTIITAALKNGKDVVVDDTNLAYKHIDRVKQLAKEYGAEFHIHTMETDVETCIKQDLARPNSVGKNVILKMYNDFFTEPTPPHDPNKLNCIICDLDGTLALFEGNPYSRDVGADVPNYHVINMLHEWDGQIVILSGRNQKYEPSTVNWLNTHEIPFDVLIMRPENDYQSDVTLKREMYFEYIEPFYNVEYVIDDRPKVVREWRRLGLFVFDVNQKGYEF